MTPSFFRQYPLKRKWAVLLLSLLALYLPSTFKMLGIAEARGRKITPNKAGFEVQEKNLNILRCHDGDTCTGEDERNYTYTLRLVGIDAPEVSWAGKRGQEFGNESKNFLEAQVKGKIFKVKLLGVDRYHRFLGLIMDDAQKNMSHSINEWMLLQGYAYAYQGKGVEPEVLKWSLSAENLARKQQKGLWALKIKPINPSEFRKLTK